MHAYALWVFLVPALLPAILWWAAKRNRGCLTRTASRVLRIPNFEQLSTFEESVWQRYGLPPIADLAAGRCAACGLPTYDRQAADRALTYLDRIVDRQINKVRGILAFDSILLVALGAFEFEKLDPHGLTAAFLALESLAVGILGCIYLFFVRWAEIEQYRDLDTEFRSTVELIRGRCIYVQLAVALSGFAVLAIIYIAVVKYWDTF